MSHPMIADRTLPRGALFGAGALLTLSLLLVAIARVTGYQPAKPPASAVVDSRDLRFVDRSDGAVLVYANPDDRLVDTLQPGTNGFVVCCVDWCANAVPTTLGQCRRFV